MKLTIETPLGNMTATVDGGFIGNAQVEPDGVVNLSFFPQEEAPTDVNNTDGFIGE